jgi:hypothetical protein
MVKKIKLPADVNKKAFSAMQAGLIKGLMSIEDIANLVLDEAAKTRGPIKRIN